MRGFRTLMLILLAAVFAVGGPLRAPPAQAAASPACHMAEMDAALASHHKAPVHKPKPDLTAMACCAGCLPAVARDGASSLGPGPGVRIVFALVNQIADGLSPTPEQGPPRPSA